MRKNIIRKVHGRQNQRHESDKTNAASKEAGVSNRKIAIELGVNKETVNNYISKAANDELRLDELVKLDDPILER